MGLSEVRVRRVAAILVSLAVTAGCSLLVSVDGLSGGAGASDAGPPDIGAGDRGPDTAVPADAPYEATPEASTPDGGSCPGAKGAVGARVGAYCIDSTEVTVGDYAEFIAATGGVPGTLPADCAWKTDLHPDAGSEGPAPLPVVEVDWCDAWAYCAWAGKRLCGQIGGGPLDPGSLNVAGVDQWFVACSQSGACSFPYCGSFDPTACNVPDLDAGALLSAGSLAACQGGAQGGTPGLFDMVGNADEWVDSCVEGSGGEAGPAGDNCTRRSGSYQDPPGIQQTCTFSRTAFRGTVDTDIGFRCCSNP